MGLHHETARLDFAVYKVYFGMSGKELVKLLEKAGWILDRVSSSHHIMKKGQLTLSVPVHANRDLPVGIANTLLKGAGLK